MYFLLYFQNTIIAGRFSPLHFKKYFLLLLTNGENYFIAIFDINFYTYVDIHGSPNAIVLKQFKQYVDLEVLWGQKELKEK